MRRGFGVGAAILVLLLLVGVGVGAYNWGVNEGLEQSGSAVEVVRYVGGHGFGFFPFFLFFPLFFLAIFALKGLWWRRHWDHDHGSGEHGRGPYGPPGVEEWHRRLHERESGGASGGGEPS
jgi:hypothetical protein